MDKLKQAIKEIQEGNNITGRQLLIEIITSDPLNENAWLWMTEVVEHDKSRQECLEKVLEINPTNEMAQRGLATLRVKSANLPDQARTLKPSTGSLSGTENAASSLSSNYLKRERGLVLSLWFITVIGFNILLLITSVCYDPFYILSITHISPK